MAVLKPFPHWEALTRNTRLTFERSAELPFIREFYLAGGTGLALHFGHRYSVDLDFFSTDYEVDDNVRQAVKNHFAEQTLIVKSDTNDTFVCEWRGVGLSFFRLQPFPLVLPTTEVEGIRLASVEDIGAMKLAAVIGRATRKDFVDLYFILKQAPIARLYEIAAQKYAKVRDFAMNSRRGLGYTLDAEETPMPRMIKRVKWETIREFLEQQAYEATRQEVERLWR
ncbi:MAG: nucleotidyl transferase AbiEii/AbiGii toxin family protein [Chloroflexi bacterium]|nr:nucleotidyl transferase AbiEii/AbiGii toxin family protein [Chloroflexota bacterium]